MTTIMLDKNGYPVKRAIIKTNLLITAHVAIIGMAIISIIIGIA